VAEPRAVKTLVDRTRATISKRGLLKGGETVVVAVSGGPDSLALLHALVRLAPELDLSLHVAHFDHRIREGSASDAAFVGRTAARLGLPATLRAADTNDTPKGLSPEEVARERRYAFLEEVADSVGASRVATGHTLDDQAETVLMRVVTGTGVRGLGGIWPIRGRIVRPLIDARRAETEAFCRALRLKPRRDPTNSDTRFLRNAVRAELLPVIEKRFNARAVEALGRLADLAREDDALLDEIATSSLTLEPVEGGWRIPIESLRRLDPALQRRVLRAAARLDSEHVERVLGLARQGSSGDSIDLPSRLNARVEYGSLVLGRAPSRPVAVSPVALAVPGTTELPPWVMQMRTWIENSAPAAWPDGRTACVLDADKAGKKLEVRQPRTGDRFRPLGMRHGKKLGDFFTDTKVPRSERRRVALVANDEGIVWVVGHRPDDRFKVTSHTKRYLWLEATGVSGETEGGAE
jgi:tRNA(Ile)-lysidine synthase